MRRADNWRRGAEMVIQTEKRFLLGCVLLVFVLLGLHPKADRLTWALENLPVMVAMPILIATHRRFAWTPLAYRFMAIHAVILMIGGYYTYAEMPVFNWLRDSLGLARNYYDRVGHLAQGFIPAILTREVLLRCTTLQRGKMLIFLVWSVCMAISASYELFEWASAMVFGSGATDFLGLQGDIWDTQADMACAAVGSVLAMATIGRLHDRHLERFQITK